MKLDKKHTIGIVIIVLAIIAFFTRKYWMKTTGQINIKEYDPEKKTVTYNLTLQGKTLADETAVFNQDQANNLIPEIEQNGKRFTFTINSGNDANEGAYMGLTLYKGSLSGLPTSDYDSITLSKKIILFDKKIMVDGSAMKTTLK
jgi:hypothetical protein